MSKPFECIIATMLVVGLLVAAGHTTAAAQGSGITLQATIGFEGYIRAGAITPVRVIVANEGPDVQAEIRIARTASFQDYSQNAVYIRSVSLPTHSRKVEMLYLPGSAELRTAEVVLERAGQAPMSVVPTASLVDDRDFLVGVISSAPSTLDMLAAIHATGTATHVAQLTLADLPPLAAAWEALDVLVIDDVATDSLSDAQRAAMASWVDRGGQLVVGGGPGWQATASGLAPLLPAEADGTINAADLPGLSAINTAPLAPGPYVLTRLKPRTGALVAVKQGDIPLVVQVARGAGRVTYLALSTTVAPLNNWSGSADLWRTAILGGALSHPDTTYAVRDFGPASEAVRSIPNLSLPSVLEIIVFLVLYVLAIGPANYLILRRLKRLELAWVSIPVIVLAFTVGIYLTGLQFRGTRPTLHRLAVVMTRAGADTGNADVLIGLFSPQRQTYDLRLPGRVPLRPLRQAADLDAGTTTQIEQDGDSTVARGVRVDIAGTRQFAARLPVAGAGIEADITRGTTRGEFTGVVRNTGALFLRNAALIYNTGAVAVGDLPPGAALTVDHVLAGGVPYEMANIVAGASASSSGRDAFRRQQLAWSALSATATGGYGSMAAPSAGTLYLTGWVDGFPSDATAVGWASNTHDLSLYLVELPVKPNPASAGEPTELATLSDLKWEITSQSGDVFSTADLQGLFLGAGASVVVDFVPLDPVDAHGAQAVSLVLGTAKRGSSPPSVSFWNWSTRHMDPVNPPLAWDTPAVVEDTAGTYVDTDGRFRMQIAALPGEPVQLTTFDLLLLGAPQP